MSSAWVHLLLTLLQVGGAVTILMNVPKGHREVIVFARPSFTTAVVVFFFCFFFCFFLVV